MQANSRSATHSCTQSFNTIVQLLERAASLVVFSNLCNGGTHEAVSASQEKAVKVLLHSGASPFLLNAYGVLLPSILAAVV
jgi:hypothetical protein